MNDFDDLPELCKTCDMLIAVPANIEKDNEYLYSCIIGANPQNDMCSFYEGLTDTN